MTDEIEVLVHISASATRRNDELFRTVANAYTEFEPHKIHRDERVQKRAKASRAGELRSDASSRRTERTLTQEATEALAPAISKDSYGSFPSNSPSSGRDQDHYSAPNGLMRPTSRLAQLDQSYLSWRKYASPRLGSKQGQGKLQISSDGPGDADTGFIEDSQSALQALQSQLEDTCSTSYADSSVDDPPDENDASKHEQPSRESSPAKIQPYRIVEEVPLPTFLEDHGRSNSRVGPLREPVNLSESMARVSGSHFEKAPNQLDFSELPLEAFPPPPVISVTSTEVLPSQITKHLAAIKTKNPGRFKPLKMQRSMETDERGYWRVDCTKWAPRIQREFWSSLYEHVCSGRIGWGTTLHRESNVPHTLGPVRLYCWGEVVEHMWLLMWLCSQGKVCNLGSEWIDANGVAVVEMN